MIIKLKDIQNKQISGIYKINYPNGKCYIGQAQNIYKRINEHNQRAFGNNNSNKKIQLCDIKIKQYFSEKVKEFELLEIVEDLTLLDEKEKYWIEYYNSTNKEKGYNFFDKGNVSGRRGCDHANASFDEKTLKEVINLIINHTELSFIDIANIYNVSQATILRISTGQSYINPQFNYPLRKNNHDAIKKTFSDYFASVEEIIKLKNDLKYSWWLSIEQDIPKKYNIPIKIVREINLGKRYSEYGNYDYPIRNKNIRNIHNLSKQDILDILSLLKNTKQSMEKIGKQYNFSRNTIRKINIGKAYPIQHFEYPARKTK